MRQDLDSIVVQIRNKNTDKIMGTGFIVDIEGIIATCWHVLEKSGIDPARPGARVSVGLPGEKSDFSAVVLTGCDINDISVLQLEQTLPYGWSSARLGSSEKADGHIFETKGYSMLGEYTGIRAKGHIMGTLEIEGSPDNQFSPLQLHSQQVDQGMSGAPILDVKTNRVVGMVSQIWMPPHTPKLRDTAFAVRVEALIELYPSLHLNPAIEDSTFSFEVFLDDIAKLLQLMDYRILDRTETKETMFFKCERLQDGRIIPCLVSVVRGKATASDRERMKQLLLSANISQGIILTLPSEV